jgi:hypothetical protein
MDRDDRAGEALERAVYEREPKLPRSSHPHPHPHPPMRPSLLGSKIGHLFSSVGLLG